MKTRALIAFVALCYSALVSSAFGVSAKMREFLQQNVGDLYEMSAKAPDPAAAKSAEPPLEHLAERSFSEWVAKDDPRPELWFDYKLKKIVDTTGTRNLIEGYRFNMGDDRRLRFKPSKFDYTINPVKYPRLPWRNFEYSFVEPVKRGITSVLSPLQ